MLAPPALGTRIPDGLKCQHVFRIFSSESRSFSSHVCVARTVTCGPTPERGGTWGHSAPRACLALIRVSNADDALLFFREKLKMKEREEAWVKIENLAKANPQVLHPQRGTAVSRLFVT